jgi:hypothetical protein
LTVLLGLYFPALLLLNGSTCEWNCRQLWSLFYFRFIISLYYYTELLFITIFFSCRQQITPLFSVDFVTANYPPISMKLFLSLPISHLSMIYFRWLGISLLLKVSCLLLFLAYLIWIGTKPSGMYSSACMMC